MKKFIALMIAFASVTAGFSQSRGGNQSNNDNRYAMNGGRDNNSRGYDGRSNERNQNIQWGQQNAPNNDGRYYDGQSNDRGYNDRERQRQIDEANREYDRRVVEYRNDRRISQQERDRRLYEVERERSVKVNSFGKGLAIGAVAGVVLDAIFSN